MPTPLRILVVYRNAEARVRPTTLEHLRSFRRCSDHACEYVNIEYDALPARSALGRYDLVVLHYLCHTARWSGAQRLARSLEPMDSLIGARVRIALLAQDEFIHADLLGWMIDRYDVRSVYSVAPPGEWEAIYRLSTRPRVRVHQVLTGYVDDETAARIDALGSSRPEPDLDIGYRTAGRPYPWFGRHGMLKEQIAHAFEDAGTRAGLRCDISTHARDTILGDDWYRFLMRCRWTIGVESGTSIIDYDGSIRARCDAYLAQHPGACFDEVERACFAGIDGSARLFAISPRHLEACITGTAQVLTQGEYNGVLRAGEHYLPLRKDFTDLPGVIEQMRDERRRRELVERVREEIVRSGRYSYRTFVRGVIESALHADLPVGAHASRTRWDQRLGRWTVLARQARSRLARLVRLRPPAPTLEI